MRRIIQKDDCGCGAACIAMLAGITYNQAAKSLYGEEEVDYTKTSEIRITLQTYGLTLAKKRVPFLRGKTATGLHRAIQESKIELSFNAIVSTRPRRDGNWHWVVWDSKRQRILDPYYNNKMPKLYSHYLQVS